MEFIDFIPSPQLDGIILHRSHESFVGTLCITGHYLIFSSEAVDSNTKQHVEEFWILHQSVDYLEKRLVSQQNGGLILIKCKNLLVFQLEFFRTDDLLNVLTSLEQLSNLQNVVHLYPFFYKPIKDNIFEDGYSMFLIENEFANVLLGDDWRISYVNKTFSVCSSYPQAVVVPKNVDDDMIVKSANFRAGGRFPVLSYLHNKNGAALIRCSEPLVGNANRRCRADEKILNTILKGCDKGYIIDTRSVGFVAQCKVKGGGTEPEGHYNQWKKVHNNLDKIVKCDFALLDSFSKLVEACSDTSCSMDKWLTRLQTSNWMSLVLEVLDASCLVAQCLSQDAANVCVHGSHGLDATLLLTSLAQIILSPDCRRIRGLQALIEREWIQSGYPFQRRHSASAHNTNRKKGAQPTFLLFLDCVHQLHQQFPCSFEFTTQLLIILFEHSYSSQFGTFLCNFEAERQIYGISVRTTSLWTYLNTPNVLSSLLNPIYEPNNGIIWPSVAPMSLTLWSGLFLRWIVDQTERKQSHLKTQQIIETNRKQKKLAQKLRKEALSLKHQNVDNDVSSMKSLKLTTDFVKN